MTALGAASGSFRMLGPVSLQQVLEVVAEFDDSGGASLGLVAWRSCALMRSWLRLLGSGRSLTG
jgi:hypothetical protein